MTSVTRVFLAMLVLLSVGCAAQDVGSATVASAPAATASDLYMKLRLDTPIKVSKLKPEMFSRELTDAKLSFLKFCFQTSCRQWKEKKC